MTHWETMWTFHTERFSVSWQIAPEEFYEYDGDDQDGEIQRKINEGEYYAFESRVVVLYQPYFDPAQRQPIPPGTYQDPLDMAQEAIPAKQATIDKYTKMYDTPESRQRLQDAFDRGKQVPNSENWYHMKQLYDAYVDELGPEAGHTRFANDFAASMAATTGGGDPTANFLMAHYSNFTRNKGQAFPASHQTPYPVGGQYAGSNMDMYAKTAGRPDPVTPYERMPVAVRMRDGTIHDAMPGDDGHADIATRVSGKSDPPTYERLFYDPATGEHYTPEEALRKRGFTDFGADNPKRYDFMHAFMGSLRSATIDEQMSGIIKPGMQMPASGSYGIATKLVREMAAKNGVSPQNFQDVAWAGHKANLTEAGGKTFDYQGPMIQHVNNSIERTHRLTGMPRDQILRRGVIRGEIPLYGAAGAAGLGAAASQAEQR